MNTYHKLLALAVLAAGVTQIGAVGKKNQSAVTHPNPAAAVAPTPVTSPDTHRLGHPDEHMVTPMNVHVAEFKRNVKEQIEHHVVQIIKDLLDQYPNNLFEVCGPHNHPGAGSVRLITYYKPEKAGGTRDVAPVQHCYVYGTKGTGAPTPVHPETGIEMYHKAIDDAFKHIAMLYKDFGTNIECRGGIHVSNIISTYVNPNYKGPVAGGPSKMCYFHLKELPAKDITPALMAKFKKMK